MLILFSVGAAALFLQGSTANPEIRLELNSRRLSTSQEVRQQTSNNSAQKTQGQSGAERLATASSLYDQGTAALQNGDLGKAGDNFRDALAIHQELAPLSLELARDLNGLGDISEQKGEARAAREFYDRALAIIKKVSPDGADHSHSLHGLGRLMRDLDEWEQAGPYLLQALVISQKLAPEGLETAAILNNLGEWYRKRKEPDKAERSLHQAMAIEKKSATESLAIAETLTDLGVLECGPDPTKGEQHLQQGLAMREKLSPNSLAIADSFEWIGWCSRDVQKAEELDRKAIEIQKTLAPGGIHLARNLNALSYALESRGELADANEVDRQAIAILENQVPDGLLMAATLGHLGRMLVREGDLEPAEEVIRKSVQITQKSHPDGKEAADGLSALGDLYYRRGGLDTAEQYHQRALEIREKLDSTSIPYSSSLRNLGFIAAARGDLVKAEQYHRRALAIRERFFPDTIEAANSWADLGSVAQERGDLPKAEEYQQKALNIWERTVPGSLYAAQGYSTLGYIAQQQGNLARAAEYGQRALDIWKKLLPGTSYVAIGLSSLGSIARQRGNPAKAEDYQRQALAIETKQAPSSPLESRILVELGNLIQDQGDLVKAEECYRQALAMREKFAPGTTIHAETLAALATNLRRQNRLEESAQFYDRSVNALENQTARLGGNEDVRSAFRARHDSLYKDYIDLLIAQHQPQVAFQVLERFRARSLLETLASARVDIRAGVNPALVEKERSLQESLSAQTDRRLHILGRKHSEQQIAAIARQIDDLFGQYKEVEEQLRSNSPGYAALTQPTTLNAQQVQERLLDSKTLLLEYSLGDDRSYLFKVDGGSVDAYELPKRDDIERAARHVYELLTLRNRTVQAETQAQKQARMKKAEAEFPKAAYELSHMLLAPVEELLGEKRLLIVSDGALQYIPFMVLTDPKSYAGPTTYEPLLVKHEIVNLPSASALAVLRQEEEGRKQPAREVAILADPVFEKDDSRVSGGRGPTHIPPDLTRSLQDIGGTIHLPRLPFTRLEAKAIMDVTPPGKGMMAVDFHANRAAVTSPALAQYRIVHLATHGLLDSKNPELSGLVMSMVDERGRPQNGFLELRDIYNLRMPVELVVLSACETGLGKDISGEGLIGLTRGFMYAGASRVVASLWSVSDVATAKLMEQFYIGIERDGLTPAAALRAAQINLSRNQRWHSPYYWGAFQIQGEWK